MGRTLPMPGGETMSALCRVPLPLQVFAGFVMSGGRAGEWLAFHTCLSPSLWTRTDGQSWVTFLVSGQAHLRHLHPPASGLFCFVFIHSHTESSWLPCAEGSSVCQVYRWTIWGLWKIKYLFWGHTQRNQWARTQMLVVCLFDCDSSSTQCTLSQRSGQKVYFRVLLNWGGFLR